MHLKFTATFLFGFLSAGSKCHAEFVETKRFVSDKPELRAGVGDPGSAAIDGDTVIVSAKRESFEGTARSGVVFELEKQSMDGNWAQKAKFAGNNTQANDRFGSTICLEDNLLIVGAGFCFNDKGTGCFYVFTRTGPGAAWEEKQQVSIPHDDNPTPGTKYLPRCSLDGNTLAISSFYVDSGVIQDNSNIYVYINTSMDDMPAWELQATISTPEDLFQVANFGGRLKVSGDTIVAGDACLGFSNIGSVLVYQRTGTTWALQQTLTPSVPTDVCFGNDVAIDGDVIAVGSYGRESLFGGYFVGAVEIFNRSEGTWTLEQVITGNSIIAFLGSGFGSTLDLRGNTLAIGAPGHHTGLLTGWNQGALYIYRKKGGTWAQESKLIASQTTGGFLFGIFSVLGLGAFLGEDSSQFPQHVSIDRNEKALVAGSFRIDVGGFTNAGAVYVFEDM